LPARLRDLVALQDTVFEWANMPAYFASFRVRRAKPSPKWARQR
jgi:hypothetical protein